MGPSGGNGYTVRTQFIKGSGQTDKRRKKLSGICFCKDATVSGKKHNFVSFLPGAAPPHPSCVGRGVQTYQLEAAGVGAQSRGPAVGVEVMRAHNRAQMGQDPKSVRT